MTDPSQSLEQWDLVCGVAVAAQGVLDLLEVERRVGLAALLAQVHAACQDMELADTQIEISLSRLTHSPLSEGENGCSQCALLEEAKCIDASGGGTIRNDVLTVSGLAWLAMAGGWTRFSNSLEHIPAINSGAI